MKSRINLADSFRPDIWIVQLSAVPFDQVVLDTFTGTVQEGTYKKHYFRVSLLNSVKPKVQYLILLRKET